MDHKPRVLAFAGSARADSYNSKLVKVAAEGVRGAGGLSRRSANRSACLRRFV